MLVIVSLGTVLFIIPGIYLACRLSFTTFLVTDRKMEAIEAVKESWRLTDGHCWTVLLIALVAIPISNVMQSATEQLAMHHPQAVQPALTSR